MTTYFIELQTNLYYASANRPPIGNLSEVDCFDSPEAALDVLADTVWSKEGLVKTWPLARRESIKGAADKTDRVRSADIEAELAKLNGTSEWLSRTLTEVTGNFQRVNAEREALDDRVHELEAQLAQVTAEREALDDRVHELEAQLAQVTAEHDGLFTRRTELLELEAPDAHEVKELRGQVAALIAKVGTLRARVATTNTLSGSSIERRSKQ